MSDSETVSVTPIVGYDQMITPQTEVIDKPKNGLMYQFDQMGKDKQIKKYPQMEGLQTDYANSNKWFATLAIEDVLGKEYANIELHLKRFSIPQMTMQTTTVAYKGYQKEIPTKVMNPDTKELTLEYIVDSDWRNYKMLYSWMSGIEGNINKVVADATTVSPSTYIHLRKSLVTPYKKKIIQFLFTDCWIKVFNDIALDVENSNEVTHSFTICYDDYKIENCD